MSDLPWQEMRSGSRAKPDDANTSTMRLRDWTSADSALRRFYSDQDFDYQEPEQAIKISPDGRYFAVLSGHGDLDDDSVVQTLEVYDSKKIAQFLLAPASAPYPQPVHRIQKKRSRNNPETPIANVRWSADSLSLSFVQFDVNHNAQLFTLRVGGNRKPIQRTHNDGATNSVFWWSEVGKNLFYLRQMPAPHRVTDRYPEFVLPVDDEGTGHLKSINSALDQLHQLIVQQVDGRPWIVPGVHPIVAEVTQSPDGRFAVVKSVELKWRFDRQDESEPARFVLLDLTNRKVLRLEANAAPSSMGQARPIFSPDGRWLILPNVAVSSADLDSRAQDEVLAFDLRSQKLRPLQPLSLHKGFAKEVTWVPSGADLSIITELSTGSRERSAYSINEGVWHTSSEEGATPNGEATPSIEPKLLHGLSVRIQQGLNEPPRLVVSDGRHEKAIVGPDPALKAIYIAHAHTFEWSSPIDSSPVTSILTLPRPVSQKPLPLIVNINAFLDPRLFNPDRPGYATQVLAARGFAVLELNSNPPGRGSSAEGPEMVSLIDAAVDALVARGVVDPQKVGLMGFSRAGFEASYVATHPGRTAIQAIAVVDSTTLSFAETLVNSAQGANLSLFGANGDPDFWANKESWMKHDILFNLDHLRSAALFFWHGNGEVGEGRTDREIGLIPTVTFGALLLSRRPFEYHLLPDSGHPPVLPRERIAEMELMADWFDFWIEDHEDENAAKSAQYLRWRNIRERWVKQKAWEDAGRPATSGSSFDNSNARQ